MDCAHTTIALRYRVGVSERHGTEIKAQNQCDLCGRGVGAAIPISKLDSMRLPRWLSSEGLRELAEQVRP